MSTFLQLAQQLQRDLGVSGTSVSAVTGQTGMLEKLVNWIADADEFIQSLYWDWKFLWSEYSIATVAGNAAPTVPSDLGVWDRESFWLNYTLATKKKLQYMDYYEWRDSLGYGVKTNSKPSYITIKPDNSIILERPPDAAYTLTGEYWKTPTRMTANGDLSAIPAQFHRIIVVQAKLWYAEEEEITTVYQAADKELNGDERGNLGLMDKLKSNQLPGQDVRRMAQSPSMTVVAE